MTVPILDESAWRRYCGSPDARGLNQTTHLAQIADASGKLHDCFVKLLPYMPALLCEAIGWILAKKAGLKVPEFAAVVIVPIEELSTCQALPDDIREMDYCYAWCSEVAAGNSVASTVRQIHTMQYLLKMKECLRSRDIRNIAAFDQWSDLRDRNFGNVIKSANGGYVPIDHETILHDLLWVPTGRTYSLRSLLVEAQEALNSKEFKKFQLAMVEAAKGHAQALTDAQSDLNDIVNKLVGPKYSQQANIQIQQTLASRGKPGWLASQLGVIA